MFRLANWAVANKQWEFRTMGPDIPGEFDTREAADEMANAWRTNFNGAQVVVVEGDTLPTDPPTD